MSRILSRISMFTGQISSQALHEVQAQISSDVMREKTLSASTTIPDAVPTGGETLGSPVASMTSPTLSTISRGSSGLPGGVRRAYRGAPAADRARVGVEELLPGEVGDLRRPEALELRLHEVRHRLHRALGTGLVLQEHVHGRRDHVAQHRGGQDHQEADERGDVYPPGPPVRVAKRSAGPRVDRAGEAPTDERPLLEVGAGAGDRPQLRDAEHLDREAGERDREERHQDDEVLRLRLDADPVRPLDVPTAEGPEDPDEEDEPEQITDERVGLVGRARGGTSGCRGAGGRPRG